MTFEREMQEIMQLAGPELQLLSQQGCRHGLAKTRKTDIYTCSFTAEIEEALMPIDAKHSDGRVEPSKPKAVKSGFSLGGEEEIQSRSRLLSELLARMKGPGGLYNCGNVIALVGGITIQSFSVGEAQSLMATVWTYLFGSLGAGCLTLAMLVFLASGEAYHRAWRDRKIPILELNRLGDFLSGIGALILTIALVTFGDVKLAIVAGCLLVIGKFGTALRPEKADSSRNSLKMAASFRMMVVVSRIPSLFALIVSLSEFKFAEDNLSDAAMAVLMLGCYLLWLWADMLLLRGRRRVVIPAKEHDKPSVEMYQ